jgi:diguanylate cyclase (GGDEF)-like protein
MKQLIAANAYSENVISVKADVRPASNRAASSVYAVFSTKTLGDKEGEFLGLVTHAEIVFSPQRIFADLLNPHLLKLIKEDTPLTEIEELLNNTVEALAVVNSNKEFVGVVTRTSVLKALLKQERDLLRETQSLNQQIALDNQQLSLWSTRLSNLHEASQTLLNALAHTQLENDILQLAIEVLSQLLQARYVAITLINEEGQLTHFLHLGISDEQIKQIGLLPEGKGLLGVVMQENTPIRLDDLTKDVRSAGFPKHHPVMKSLLAVPVSNLGHIYGSIYLCDKTDDSHFNAEDELLAKNFATSLSLILENVRKIAKIKCGQDHLYHLAHFDPLTELPNRELAYDRIRQALLASHRKQTKSAILFADLDNFKHVNDSLGHSAGDILLKEVALRLQQCIREMDTVARLGGDEFLILLPDFIDMQSIITVAQKIKETLQPIFEINHHEIIVSISIGISIYPDDASDMEKLLRNADTAMYHAKSLGRNNFQFFTHQMNEEFKKHVHLTALLSRAIEREQFVLCYQPQINLITEKMFGVEALIRWHSPELGIMFPIDFIPTAEASGLIVTIGDWVLMTACRQGYCWLNEGLNDFRIAVNLSSVQFQQGQLATRLKEILMETQFPPALLELEITESIMMSSKAEVLTTLKELKLLGVQISIDDFGTGYSSLSYLKTMPIDKIKIDQSFVRDITSDSNDAAIVNAIIAMAHGLNLDVIAEGVESKEQLDFLITKGCYEAQGYYFSQPIPAEEITAFWHNQLALL